MFRSGWCFGASRSYALRMCCMRELPGSDVACPRIVLTDTIRTEKGARANIESNRRTTFLLYDQCPGLDLVPTCRGSDIVLAGLFVSLVTGSNCDEAGLLSTTGLQIRTEDHYYILTYGEETATEE